MIALILLAGAVYWSDSSRGIVLAILFLNESVTEELRAQKLRKQERRVKCSIL